MARLGANDPDFNLRRDALLIHRKEQSKDAVFLSTIESHGSYSRVTELVNTPYRVIKSIEIEVHNNDYTVFTIISKGQQSWTISFSHNDNNAGSLHNIEAKNKTYSWKGPVQLIKN
jgi:hypothetical protein